MHKWINIRIMKNEYNLNLFPSESDLSEIKDWLIEEDSRYNEGFYCNWNIIEKSFHRGEVISFKLNKKIIGFVAWSRGNIYVDIDIMEIHYDYRKNGLGRIFLKKIENIFREKGYLAIELFCEPRESEHFWKKMGFIKFPERGYSESDLTFYKPLIEVFETTEILNNNNILELWDVEPYLSHKKKPRWIWNIEIKDGKLLKPIIQPCNVNWNVRWTKNGEIIKEDKVKYFSRDNSIEFSPFMYVERLNKE